MPLPVFARAPPVAQTGFACLAPLQHERRLRLSSLAVSLTRPRQILQVCPAQPRKIGSALNILRPRKQSFLKGFTKASPHGHCQDEVHTSRPRVFRRALLHSQPRSPTPTIPKHAVERGRNLHTGPAELPFVPHAQRPQANSSIVEAQPSLPPRSEQKRATASSALESQGFGLCFPFVTALFRR